jgi:hypothetical protein
MFGKEDKLFERRRDIKEGIIKDNDDENDYYYPLKYNSKENKLMNEYHYCLSNNQKLKGEIIIKENILKNSILKMKEENKLLDDYIIDLNNLLNKNEMK